MFVLVVLSTAIAYSCELIGTQTTSDLVSDFARKNNLDKFVCVNCNKRGGLCVDGVALNCTRCRILSLVSEYKSNEEKNQERLLVRELIGTETAGFRLSNCISQYNCIECGESLSMIYYVTIYYCFKCKKYFNIERGS